MHSASWRVGDEPTVATLAQMMTETTIQDPGVESKNRMLGDGPKGGTLGRNWVQGTLRPQTATLPPLI